MWPFSTKEPLNPDKLPVPAAWIQRQTHDPLGRTMYVRANAAYSKFKGVTGYTQYGSQYVLVQTVTESAPVTGPTPTPNWREKLLGF